MYHIQPVRTCYIRHYSLVYDRLPDQGDVEEGESCGLLVLGSFSPVAGEGVAEKYLGRLSLWQSCLRGPEKEGETKKLELGWAVTSKACLQQPIHASWPEPTS